MITIPELAAEFLGSYLAEHMGRRFSATDAAMIELVPSAARLALDCIGNSDAPYHNVEHTMLVTLVGYDIMKGRRLVRQTSAGDCAHLILGCLFHDIGFVRGILEGDGDGYVINAAGDTVKLPRGSSDAALTPYHVDRSKLYVLDRMSNVEHLDAARIANAIEYTRFPSHAADDGPVSEEGMLLRAADLIGTLGDPHYLRKANALYSEFEEVGMNRQLGYTSPADLVDLYPQFYWKNISGQIETAVRHPAVGSGSRTCTVMSSGRNALSICLARNARACPRTIVSPPLARPGEAQQARELLALVYGWFAEGFDTRSEGGKALVL